jgi:hypothetical protein
LAKAPAIEFSDVPVADPGGPALMESIGGRVTNAKPGQQIVLYARSGVWWIQPMDNRPFTHIQPDSTWRSSTHLGTEYSALLVDAGYRPASKLVLLPPVGNGVAAIVIAKGNPASSSAADIMNFSGYEWSKRSAASDRGGESNSYDPANAWTDDQGRLHLRMDRRKSRWSCGEVSLNRSLGYGTYRFVVADSAHLDPSAVLGIYTWDDSRSEGFQDELDIELSRWGNPQAKNAQYVIQPFYAPPNLVRFTAPAGILTYEFRWNPDSIAFRTYSGTADAAKTIANHVFTSGVPSPAHGTLHINLYDFHHAESSTERPAEAVIQSFEFIP